MVFWRKKKNGKEQEREETQERIIHRPSDPALEPPTEYDSDMDERIKHELNEREDEVIEDLKSQPVPRHTPLDDDHEREDLSDHSGEGGWFSRLTKGLKKSSNKISQGLTDLVTKKKLDDEMLEQLEEVLISADLGPSTAARLVEEFGQGRFGKEISEEEIKGALAESVAKILEPVAKPLVINKPAEGPFVVLVCGVNGVGKTTTIGKLAQNLYYKDKKSVMMAAGDTFRAAAVEQLQEWAKRTHSGFYAKDVAADSAAVAFEAYQKAKEQDTDVLLIDTAGRLQNKKNLMEELQKIVRVLKKQDESLPHAVLLVLDATTGQNAFSQVETFKEMVNVTGLIVTKLDGSAKGGVLVGLADKFGVPVHAIGIGEQAEDMQPFAAKDYARSLMGLED